MNQKYSWGAYKTGRYMAHLWRDAMSAGMIWSACGLYRKKSMVGSPITDHPRCKSCEKAEQRLINEITGN